MGRANHPLTFWLQISTQYLLSSGGCIAMVDAAIGVMWVAHYLDNYITLGPPRSLVCQSNLDTMLMPCRRAGYPSCSSKV